MGNRDGMTFWQGFFLCLAAFALLPLYYFYVPLFDECRRYKFQTDKASCDSFQSELNRKLYWEIKP